jgi:hypothetical protein
LGCASGMQVAGRTLLMARHPVCTHLPSLSSDVAEDTHPPTHHVCLLPRYIIIPVNITVGAAGSVLITLKSER